MFNKFVTKKKLKRVMEERPCTLCIKYKTTECPNHGKCLEDKRKPHFSLDVNKL